MMKELQKVPPKDGYERRWFFDDQFDLIFWVDQQGGILGFQLCYDKDTTPHALTWSAAHGFNHETIDEQRGPHYPQTPILVPDGVFPYAKIIKDLRRASENLEPKLRELVIGKIEEYFG